MSFLAELWRFMRARKKFWLLPILADDGPVRRPARADPGLRRRAVHLHAVLSAPMRILGISAFYHDSAAALVDDGRIVAAAQEERFTRKKHDARFPAHAVALLPRARPASRSSDVDHVAFYDKPFLKFERLLETYLAFAPRGFALVPHGDAALAARRSCSRRICCIDELRELDAPDFDWDSEAAVHRAPPEPRRERLLSLAVRARRRSSPWTASASGRRPVARRRARQRARDLQGDPLPAFARPALLRLHLLHRLQGQLRRVQGDGARALRRAADTRSRSSTT